MGRVRGGMIKEKVREEIIKRNSRKRDKKRGVRGGIIKEKSKKMDNKWRK